ncbi:MAG: hypothetical protein ITD31_07735 [Nitrosospira sp.]|nr:hypothetical protein [Nitrosospira sp.]
MNKTVVAILLGMAITLPTWAHTDDYLDTLTTAHGGQLRMAGPYHLELVAKDKELVLYVTDHGDNPVKTEGGTAKATIQIGKGKAGTTVKLEPAGENQMKGLGEFTLKPESVIVVFVKLAGDEAQSARFTPLKPKAKAAAAKKPAASKPAASTPAPNHSGHQHMHH